MKLFVVLMFSAVATYSTASELEASYCDGNCGTVPNLAGGVNQPLFDLSEALRNVDLFNNGTPRVLINHDKTPVRLPVVQVRRGEFWLSGGYVSPCLVLTAKHGIITDRYPTTSGPKARVSSETDAFGKAINYRETEILPLDEDAVDLILLRDPSCAGGKLGFFEFVSMPPMQGNVKDFATLFVSFPMTRKLGPEPDSLFVTKCNSKFSDGPWDFHDCHAPPGSSGGFLLDTKSVQDNGELFARVGVKVFLARGVHVTQNPGKLDTCTIDSCNLAIGGGEVAAKISELVDKDIEEFLSRKAPTF